MFSEEEKKVFERIVRSRRSVRQFRDREIPWEVLMRILETGRLAASAANRQPWYFLVARKSENNPLYSLLAGRTLAGAPVLILGLADRGQAWVRKSDGVNYAWVDVTIALTEMILKATAEGLGSCWIGAFDSLEAARILDLPEGIEPVAMVALGYPEDSPEVREKNRKPLDGIIKWGTWASPTG